MRKTKEELIMENIEPNNFYAVMDIVMDKYGLGDRFDDISDEDQDLLVSEYLLEFYAEDEVHNIGIIRANVRLVYDDEMAERVVDWENHFQSHYNFGDKM